MKKLFKAIRKGDLQTVQDIIRKNNELVNCVAKQPPKKDDGQSPLQVALKCGQFEIANYLLDCNASVTFIDEDGINTWNMPVVHDAIIAAINCSRWLNFSYGRDSDDNLIKIYDTFMSTEEKANKAYDLLKRMIDMGAQINCADSKGKQYSGLERAFTEASTILPKKTDDEKCPINDELIEDFTRIFKLLLESGSYVNEPCTFFEEMTLIEYFSDYELERFLYH